MSPRRLLLVFSTITALIPGMAHGQEELAVLQIEYDISLAKLAVPITELQKNYRSQLEKLRDQTRASGSLEKTQAVDEEIKGFTKGSAPPAGAAFPELGRLRFIYATEATAKYKQAMRDLPALVRAHKAKLVALQKTLTKQDRLEEAQKVKDALAKVVETLDVTVPAVPAIGRPTNPAVIETTVATKPFQKGEIQFTNREFVWGFVPQKFQDWVMTMRAGGSEVDTRFKVKTAGLVYAVIGPSVEKQFVEDDWKKVAQLRGGPGGKQDYLVIERPFEPGDYTISGEGWFTTRLLLPPSSQQR